MRARLGVASCPCRREAVPRRCAWSAGQRNLESPIPGLGHCERSHAVACAREVTSELQEVVGKAASMAIQTWVRNNDKTKARAEEREKNIG